MINNIEVVSGEEGRGSVIQIHVPIRPLPSPPSRLAHNIGYLRVLCNMSCWFLKTAKTQYISIDGPRELQLLSVVPA